MGLTYMLAGLALFFGPHFYSAFRKRAVLGPGEKPKRGLYHGLYSLISLAGLALMIWGYGAMRPAQILYTAPIWGRHLNLILMIPALILLVSAYMPAGRIKKAVKHPMLAAVKLWALGHLLANGELNAVLLFGSFLVFGIVDRIAVKRRGDNGPAALAPNAALWDLLAVGTGSALYVLFTVWAHQAITGMPVMS
jgi:uncharacterized membrane protein